MEKKNMTVEQANKLVDEKCRKFKANGWDVTTVSNGRYVIAFKATRKGSNAFVKASYLDYVA